MRENASKCATRQAAALAFAGLLAFPLLATQGNQQASARIGPTGPGVTGIARVTDGDTIVIDGVKVRLEGIDAPELEQVCGRRSAGSWKCGREAADHVARLIRDRTVTCTGLGTDAYGRMLGICTVEGLDINADLVRNGLAWAFVKYSQRYVGIEAEARAAGRGVWQGEAKPAWLWRAERWQEAAAEKREGGAADCLIKGNITRGGQIYHMPWDRWYDKTRIETAKGERWFCSEAEAATAGWRPAVAR